MKQANQNTGVSKMKVWMIIAVVMFGVSPWAEAAVGRVVSKGARKVATTVARKAGKEGAETAAEQGTRALARQACRKLKAEAVELCVRYGDDAARYIARHGDDGVRFLQRFGDDGLRLVTRHGDDAAVVLAKHPGIATDLIRVGGGNAVKALKKLDPQAAIKLARESAALARKGQLDEVLKRIIAEPGRVTYQRFKEILELVLRNSVRVGGAVAITAVGLNAADTIGAPADSMRAVTAVVTNKLEQLDPEVVLDKASAASVKITLGTVAIVTFFLFLLLYLLLARLIPRRRRKKETADRRPPTAD